MTFASLLAAALGAVPVTEPAPAQSTHHLAVDGPLPYAAWTDSRYGGPPGELQDRAAPPGLEEPEHARRLFEVAPDAGVALPACASGDANCARLLGGASAGLTLLYRISPFFAFGAGARYESFTLAQGASPVAANATFFGVAGRVYACESGALDPYLDLQLGGGSLVTRSRDGIRAQRDGVDFAPGLRIAAGLDFVLSGWARLGPVLSFSRYAPSTAERCFGSECTAFRPARSAIVHGSTSLGLSFTIATGQRL